MIPREPRALFAIPHKATDTSRRRGPLVLRWLAGVLAFALLFPNSPPAPAQTGLVSVTVITTQSCTADVNDSWSQSPRVRVRIGPHAVTTDDAGYSAPLLLPPGSYTVFAASEQDPGARLGYVSQGYPGLRIEAKLDGGAPVTLGQPQEGLQIRMLTCDPGGQPITRATVAEIGGRITITRKGVQLNGYLGAPLLYGDSLTIKGTGKLTWLDGGTISFDDPRGAVIKIGPLRPQGVAAPERFSFIQVLKGIVTFFLPPSEGRVKRYKFEAGSDTVKTGVRATRFTLGYDDLEQVSTISVSEGSVDVTPVNPALNPFVLSVGQQVQVSLNHVGPITPVADAAGQAASSAAASSCFGNDRGAANLDRDAHYYWAQQNMAKVAGNLNQKIDLLWRCPAMNDEQLTSVFADLSVIVERYVPGAACSGGERERERVVTGLPWQPHKDWASQRSRQEVLSNLQGKVAAALQCMDSTGQINFFADASAVIAKAPLGITGSTAGAKTPAPATGPAPLPAPASAKGCVGFAGEWSTTHGEVFLNLTGDSITGTNPANGGSISGRVTGPVLDGDWVQPNNRSGKLRFALAADGDSFKGTWTEADRPGGPWDGTCAGPPQAASQTIDAGTERLDGTRSLGLGQPKAAPPAGGTAQPPAPGAVPAAAPQPVSSSAQGCVGFVGSWKSTAFGDLSLREEGGTVSGTFDKSGLRGTVRGSVTGNRYSGDWSVVGGNTGKFQLELLTGGNSYKGELGMEGWGANDEGTCVSGPGSTTQRAMQRADSTADQPASGQMIDAGKEKLRGEQPVPAGMIRIKVHTTAADSPVERPKPVRANVRVTVQAGSTYEAVTTGGWATVDVPSKPEYKYTVEVSSLYHAVFEPFQAYFDTKNHEFRLDQNDPRERTVEFRLEVGGDKIELRFRVTREGTTEAVPQAKVRVSAGKNTNVVDEIWTDANGYAMWRVTRIQSDTYPVEVSKEHFETKTRQVFVPRNDKSTWIDVPIELRRAAGVEARVKVIDKDDRSPAYGASVVFVEESLGVSLSRGTEPSGEARVFLTKPGRYKVQVTHSKFEPESQEVQVRIGGSESIGLEFKLTRKPESESFSRLTVWVKTKTRDARGQEQEQPIPGAEVSAPNSTPGVTNSQGRTGILIQGAIGGAEVEVTAKAAGYRSNSRPVSIRGEKIGARAKTDVVTIYLEPGESSDSPIQLTVRVVDSANPDTPIDGASVTLKLMDGRVVETRKTGAQGDPQGDAVFTISETPQMSLQLVRAGLMADVTNAPGYKDKLRYALWADLQPSRDRKMISISLDDDFAEKLAEATAQVAALERLVEQIKEKLARMEALAEAVEGSEKDIRKDLDTLRKTVANYDSFCAAAKRRAEVIKRAATQDLDRLGRDERRRNWLRTDIRDLRKELNEWDNNPDISRQRMGQHVENFGVVRRFAEEAWRQVQEHHTSINNLVAKLTEERLQPKVKLDDLLRPDLSPERKAQVEALRFLRDVALKEGETSLVASKNAYDQVFKAEEGIRSALPYNDRLEVRPQEIKLTCESAKRMLESTAGELRAALSTSIGTLEAKVAAWKNDAAEASAKITALENQASEDAKTEMKALALADGIRQAAVVFGYTEVPGLTAPARCQKAAQLKKSLKDYKEEADQREQQLKKRLDEASTLAANCSSQADASEVKRWYNTAIQLAGQIGALEKKAIQDNAELATLEEQSKDQKRILGEVEKKVTEIFNLWASADRAASIAEADFQRASELTSRLGARRSALNAELQALRAQHEVVLVFDALDSNPGSPTDLKKRLDDLGQLLGSNAVSLRAPDAKWPTILKQRAVQIEEYHQRGEDDLERYKAQMCDMQAMDDVVTNIGSLVTSAMIEISAAAKLRDKAEECEKRALTPTTMIPPSLGPRVVGAPLPPKVPTKEIPAIVGPPASAAPPPPKPTPPPEDYRAWMTGTFDTGGGVLKLSPAGGTYEYYNGRMTNIRIEGRVMEGRWEQDSSAGKCPDGRYYGRFRLTFSENGFTGLFGYCDEEPTRVGGFQGTRRKP